VALMPPAHEANEPVPLTISRSGAGRLYYGTQLKTVTALSPDAVDRGIAVRRHYEPYLEGRGEQPAATTFDVGDIVRVVVTTTLRAEGRYVALTDVMPAGFEAIDEDLDITRRSLADEATAFDDGDADSAEAYRAAWNGFDHIEKRDDRVLAFATRLSPGQHRFSYLVRATTAGTFNAAGTSVELMYVPDVSGRSAVASVTVK
jgi:uncharacterized protein YfaS (alpha-2-macroglobulin family)